MLKYICLLFVSIGLLSLSYGQNGKVSVMPQNLTVHQGQEFELLVFVHPAHEPVSVADLFLTYDTLFIKALEIEKIESPLGANPVEPAINAQNGIISYSAFTLNTPPQQPFQLVKLKFVASNETPSTRIYHDLKATFKTTLAYAGRDNLSIASDIEIIVLPEFSSIEASALGRNVLSVENGENDLINAVFSVKDKSLSKLIITNDKNEPVYILFNNMAHPGMEYFFEIDLSGLPPANYNLMLENSGIVTKQLLSRLN